MHIAYALCFPPSHILHTLSCCTDPYLLALHLEMITWYSENVIKYTGSFDMLDPEARYVVQ